MVQALQRECREEINCQVEVGDILYIREYIGRNREFAAKDGEVHQIEYMFLREIAGLAVRESGSCPITTRSI
jgi:8-oxo-dGTP diphosphatase